MQLNASCLLIKAQLEFIYTLNILKYMFKTCKNVSHFLMVFLVLHHDKALSPLSRDRILGLCLKLVSFIFYQSFIFHQMIALQKLRKTFFISSKKLFSFLRYLNFVFSSSPLFLLVSHCFTGWSKKNFKIYDVINCLNKNLITHFIWYLEKEIRCDIETLSIDRELNKEHFYGKIMQKMCTKC